MFQWIASMELGVAKIVTHFENSRTCEFPKSISTRRMERSEAVERLERFEPALLSRLRWRSIERGADCELVELPEFSEPDWIVLGLGRELRVDRHRCRPLPVRSCGDELCVAQRVPRMAVDRATTRLITEDREPGRVRTGAGRLRAAARDELELLGVCLRIGLSAGDVATHELVCVFWCRNHAARGPRPAGGDELGDVFGHAGVVALIAVHEWPRELGIAGEGRLDQTKRHGDQTA